MRRLFFALAIAAIGTVADADKAPIPKEWDAEMDKALSKVLRSPPAVPVEPAWFRSVDEVDHHITMMVKSDGTVVDVRYRETENDQLPEKIKRKIMEASPLPAAPEYMPDDTYEFTILLGKK